MYALPYTGLAIMFYLAVGIIALTSGMITRRFGRKNK